MSTPCQADIDFVCFRASESRGIWEFIAPALILYLFVRYNFVLCECYFLHMFLSCTFFIVFSGGYITVTIILVGCFFFCSL